MVFSSPTFLFIFLPVVLCAYYLMARNFRNAMLLVVSISFYAWGEKLNVFVLLTSIAVNYILGFHLERAQNRWLARALISLAVVSNLGILGAFKYANFLVDNLNHLLALRGSAPIHLAPVHLPLGISFFTFHAMSYVIDIYRREVRALRNPINFALYISFFPQSIAGPIVRYHDIEEQLGNHETTLEGFAGGARRFVLGLAKKMMLANTLALPAQAIFDLPAESLHPSIAWLGAICYTLQIYFDFSGYSDMAIGLAGMFGFRFRENFNYPYIATSITDFWRRWHISLSSWFRDYLYIPLGGNRCQPWRVYLNLAIVFFLCGLWHGANWTFIVWGLYHGLLLVLERLGVGRILERCWSPLRHVYVLLAVMAGWVFFRANSLTLASAYFGALAGRSGGSIGVDFPVGLYLTKDVLMALVAAGIGSMPLLPWLEGTRERLAQALEAKPVWSALMESATVAFSMALMGACLLLSAMLLAAGTYNPFIYFRF